MKSIIKVSREVRFIRDLGIHISNNIACFPSNDDKASFDLALAACRVKFSGLKQTEYINGLLASFQNTVVASDPRLQPCGPVIGMKRITMKIARQNALSLASEFLNSST